MRIEDMLRDAMRAEGAEMPEMQELEARFEQRRRRYRVARFAQVGAVAAALVAIAIVVLPRLGSGTDDGGFVGPGNEPTPTTSPALPPEPIAEDRVIGFRALLPGGWLAVGDEGGITNIVPSELGGGRRGDLRGTANVPVDFFVSIIPTPETFHAAVARVRARYAEDEANHGITVSQENQVEIGGRHAVSFAAVYPAPLSEEFASDEPGGCPSCRTIDYVVHWFHGRTLQIRVVARSTEANERWGGEGLQIVAGIERMWVDGYEYAPLHGSAGTVEVDETTEEVLRFMDARIDGEAAEEWLSLTAERQYRDADDELSLYSRTSNPHYVRYQLISRMQADANSWEYVVEIVEGITGGDESGSFRERLFVGQWPEVIRGAMLL